MHACVCGVVRTSKQLSCARLVTHRQRSDGQWDWTFELMKINEKIAADEEMKDEIS
jgi:hypothetical protein